MGFHSIIYPNQDIKKKLKRIGQHIIFCLFVFLSIPLVLDAQTDFKSQDDLKKKADEYFKKEDYSSAMPLYSQLVSIYSKDPAYNYRFGVCVLFADRRETEKPIKYLEFASAKPGVDVSVFYYLGLAYHHNYRFAEAIKEYKLYKENAGIKNAAKLDVGRQIEICNNAKNLLTHFSDLYVLQRTEVVYNDFFRSYDAERFGGKLLVKPDIFKTSLDRKREKLSLVFFSKENDEVYFSSYGIDGKNGKDIYKSMKLPGGKWSKPINLGPTINTPYDEDFPFILPDGVTLYYSSKGMNTIGGYDIFTSTLGDDGTWTISENLNYPINTPFDDIMFVPDSSQQYAYFSSARSSMEGMISVYKVRIDKRPQVNEILALDKNINISPGDETAYTQTIQFLKEKATLEVNATESMFEEEDNKNDIIQSSDNNNNELTEDDEYIIPENITNDDIVNIADKQSKDALQELKELKTQRNAANTIAQNRKLQAETKYNEADSITKIAETISDVDTKQTELAKVNNLHSEAEQLNKESVIATNIADQLDVKVNIKQKEANDALLYAKEIKAAVLSNSIDTSIAMLNKMIDNLEKSSVDTNLTAFNVSDKEFIKHKEKESQTLAEQAKQIQDEVNLLKSEADNDRKDAAGSKKKNVKEQFNNKAVELDNEAKTKQAEADQILQKSEKLQFEADSARAQLTIYANVVDDIKSNNTTAIATHAAIANNTKAEVLTKTENIVKAVQKEAGDLKKQTDIAYAIAGDKNNQSLKMLREADNLIAETSEIANTDDKEKSIKKANELRQESIILAQQSVVAYNLAKKIEVAYNEKQQEVIGIVKKTTDIKELANFNKINEAETKYSELQSSIVPQTNTTSVTDLFQFEQANLLDNKEYELQQATEDYKLLQSKTDSLFDKSNSLREEADNTTKKSIKDKLIKQAEQIEAQETAIQKQVNETNDLSNKLKIEVGELKIKIKYTANLITETSTYKISGTSTVDKTELEKQIAQYETKDIFAEVNTENTNDMIAEKINDSKVVETISSIDEKILAQNLDNESDSSFKRAAEKRIEANKTDNVAQKEKLRTEAKRFEENAQIKQLEALEVHGIANKNLYYTNSLKISQIKVEDETNKQLSTAGILENESRYYFEKAKTLRESVKNETNYTQKKNILEEVKTNEQLAIEKQLKAIDIYTKAVPAYATELTTTNITKTEFKGIYINNDNTATAASTHTPTPNIDAAGLVPLNPKLPAGIIFKVQIAAVRNHVVPDVFKGITPLTGEITATGLIRYLAGLFAKFEDANTARNRIRTMGYADAYVVAYYNSKRISVAEALAMLKNDNSLATTYADLNNKTYLTASPNINTTAGLSNPIANIKGFLYSVQVGVYGRPRTSAQLFNITPLYDEVMANGYYRYLSGIYSSLKDAVTAKNTIVVRGVKDAFVVVYYNGNKITMAEAKTLLTENVTLAGLTNTTYTEIIDKSGIIYKVQLGAYKNDVPVDVVNQFLDNIAGNNLEHNMNNDGLTVYTSGNFKDYDSANNFKNTLVSKGMKDAFVVAFQNGQKISVAKAIELLK